jgi:CheY-like chemotaxis protein
MSSARLLVVDDDVAGLYALAEALRRQLPDVTVDTASSAERALVLLGAARFSGTSKPCSQTAPCF